MQFKLVKDNVNKIHIELCDEQGNHLLPKDGFESAKDATIMINTIREEAGSGKLVDLTNVECFAE